MNSLEWFRLGESTKDLSPLDEKEIRILAERLEKELINNHPSAPVRVIRRAAAVALLLCFISSSASAQSTGLASWYSYESAIKEGNPGITANGEKMVNQGMTCAVRSRRFGTRYKVTNLENGKSVIVRHNDYGPGKKPASRGVIIDLSVGAFKKIANPKDGLAKVKIEEIK